MPSPLATICILTYGDYLPYFRRCLLSVLENTPPDVYELRLGFNCSAAHYYFALGRLAVGAPMPSIERQPHGVERATFLGPSGIRVRTWNSPVNLYKEPMCRLMYYDVPLETEYVVWLDDDSFVDSAWWGALSAKLAEGIDYLGQRWWVYYLPGQAKMIAAQPWHQGRPFELKKGRPGVSFMTGGFMAVRSTRIREANYPDVDFDWKGDRLKQYGGDTLLGEIARQHQWRQEVFDTGVYVNVDLQGRHPAPRRGGTGRQFGSDLDVAIR